MDKGPLLKPHFFMMFKISEALSLRHLRKFAEIKKENFYGFLKKRAWHFNGGHHTILLNQLKSLYKSTKR